MMEEKVINSILHECQSAIDQFDDVLEGSSIEHLLSENDISFLYENLNMAQVWVERGYAVRARDYVRKLYNHLDRLQHNLAKDRNFTDWNDFNIKI